MMKYKKPFNLQLFWGDELNSDKTNTSHAEHGEEFVCVVMFRIDGDDDNIGKTVVPQKERDDCINAILKEYPHEQLDFSTEFLCKKCFEEIVNEQLTEESELGHISSRMIH